MSLPKQGERVTWRSSQGTVKGKVVKTVTEPTSVKGHTAKASKDDPQIMVKSEKTGAVAIHKPDALHRNGNGT